MEDFKIDELQFTPNADKKKVFPVFFITLAISGVLVILSVKLPLYQGIISFLAVVGISIALYFYSRYIASYFTYSVIINSNGEAVFLVNKIAGKRSSLMFMSYLFEMQSIEKLSKKGENRYLPAKEAKKYNFTATYGIEEFYVLKFNTQGLISEVSIECTDELANKLSGYIQIAKAEYEKGD